MVMAVIRSAIPFSHIAHIHQDDPVPRHMDPYNSLQIRFPSESDAALVTDLAFSIGDTIQLYDPNVQRPPNKMDYIFGTITNIFAPSLGGSPPQVYLQIRKFYRRTDILNVRLRSDLRHITHRMVDTALVDTDHTVVVHFRHIHSHFRLHRFDTRAIVIPPFSRLHCQFTARVRLSVRRDGTETANALYLTNV
ncbi:hypothetical protein JVU11DRAFT_9271 [Chiua virens]|nr:hypothetical protein JVU11DRAFT_9256 [Chiua virens]KAG9310681.1 hypothetical protein JVU11DRAFT_9271 [Chiua virens]